MHGSECRRNSKCGSSTNGYWPVGNGRRCRPPAQKCRELDPDICHETDSPNIEPSNMRRQVLQRLCNASLYLVMEVGFPDHRIGNLIEATQVLFQLHD